MTAPIGTAANVFSGMREYSQVTNSYSGYFKSAGNAYNLILPFNPHKFEWYNFTEYATNSKNIQGVWYRDMPAADALIVARGTTTLTSTLEATNGVTDATTTGGFYNEHLAISGITTATPAVVTTSTNHNLTSGDRVVITKVIGTMANPINNQTYVVGVLSATTFGLYDTFGVPITTVGSYTSSGQVTKTSPALGDPSAPNPYGAYPVNSIINQPPQYILTLGTAVVGANADVIYFTAWHFNSYFNLGQIA